MSDQASVKLDRRLLARLWAVIQPYRGWVALAILLTVAVAALGPLRPKLVQVAIDQHVVSGDGAGLLRIVALLSLVLLIESALSFGMVYITQWVGQNTLHDLRRRGLPPHRGSAPAVFRPHAHRSADNAHDERHRGA